MSYKITKRIKPKGIEYITFQNKSGSPAIINFNEMNMNMKMLCNINENVMNDEIIEINFPIFDHYYSMEYKSKNGWSLKKLILTIYKTAKSAGQYLIKYQPQLFNETEINPTDFVNKYCITSSGKKSDLLKKNNIIYVNITPNTNS